MVITKQWIRLTPLLDKGEEELRMCIVGQGETGERGGDLGMMT